MRFRRLAARAAAVISSILCATFLITSPALADGSANSLSPAAGHTCIENASFPHGSFVGLWCVEIAIYNSSSGQHFVTTQVEVSCPDTDMISHQCTNESVSGEVANGTGTVLSGTKTCSGNCPFSLDNFRTYMFPFGGLPAPTTVGKCDNNVWGVALTQGQIDRGGSDFAFLSNNLGTPHYNVCLTSSGYTFTRV